MPTEYGPEAVEHCLRLYLKYNGRHHERIEAEMRKLWPDWTKSNLYSRRGSKEGWIKKFNWEGALKLHLAQKPLTTLNSAQQLVNEIEFIRKNLYAQITSQGGAVSKDKIQQHLKYCDLSIYAMTKVEAAHDMLGNFASFWEILLEWLVDMDEKAARALLKVSDRILERVAAEYANGKKSTDG
jgi:hypothetical protein